MFGRRPSSQVVFVGSLIAAIVLAIIAVHEYIMGSLGWAALWGALTVWFMVDALRAWGWTKNK